MTDRKKKAGQPFARPTTPRHAGIDTPPPLLTETDMLLTQPVNAAERVELLGRDDDERLEVADVADRLERHADGATGNIDEAAQRIVYGRRSTAADAEADLQAAHDGYRP